MTLPSTIVVMGVSGAGKSTLGIALATELERPFIDADDLHPPANKAKMKNGIPLTDEDRAPWLDAVATAARESAPVVVACSALKRTYRDRFAATATDVSFVELIVPYDELSQRLADRKHEFMSGALLDSQLETLEPLADDERGVRFHYGSPGSPTEAARQVSSLLKSVRQ